MDNTSLHEIHHEEFLTCARLIPADSYSSCSFNAMPHFLFSHWNFAFCSY